MYWLMSVAEAGLAMASAVPVAAQAAMAVRAIRPRVENVVIGVPFAYAFRRYGEADRTRIRCFPTVLEILRGEVRHQREEDPCPSQRPRPTPRCWPAPRSTRTRSPRSTARRRRRSTPR